MLPGDAEELKKKFETTEKPHSATFYTPVQIKKLHEEQERIKRKDKVEDIFDFFEEE